ncbi:uncharacterized protein LODBEIA_P59220 [Lodderomyces beijingensis]|uniref:RING-type E3 ubiquitin transferase n=1 Tax=Lodderomyces beijingensis TaxID=1775926 RepID=A0ABP0ZU79_9ASCO
MLSYKEKAQESMLEGDFSGAINFYTLALKTDSSNSKLLSSRARAYYLNSQGSASSNPSQTQWKKILDDCNSALVADKENYEALYYSALAQAYGYGRLEKGLKALGEAYTKSLARAKSSKQYSLPQDIYLDILKLKQRVRQVSLHTSLNESNPFFNKLVYLLQQEYEKDLQELLSKQITKDCLDYATTKLAVRYNKEVKELVEMFKLKNRGREEEEMQHMSNVEVEHPDFLCDPISFNLFHDPVITPSGQSFEKAWLWQHLSSKDYDPLTRQKLSKDNCYPNLGLKACVDHYLAMGSKLEGG